jgi:predicted nuclease of predicted toxin-antitoxin system
MRLLLDQNLSWRLVEAWADVFPGSTHVRQVEMTEADDKDLWALAARDGFVIISKDSDFDDEIVFRGPPPKAIHLLVGNASTQTIDALVRASLSEILDFENDGERVLEIG